VLVTGRVRLEGAGKGREDKGSKVDNDGLWDGVVPRVCWMIFLLMMECLKKMLLWAYSHAE
jgi:hypothetical protein